MDASLSSLKNYDWFASLEESNNRFIVYVHRMGTDISNLIPRFVNDKQVLVHFACFKDLTKEKYVKSMTLGSSFAAFVEKQEAKSELSKMERIYSINDIEDIFYEIVDQDDSVSSVSREFPILREKIERVYTK